MADNKLPTKNLDFNSPLAKVYFNNLTNAINNLAGVSGTTDEITVASNVVGLASNTVMPGSAGMRVPSGTTGQRTINVNATIRYNTTTNKFELYENGSWATLGTSVQGDSGEVSFGLSESIQIQGGTGIATAAQAGALIISTSDSGIDHDSLLNFEANEHIDWTSTTSNLSTSGSIQGADITATSSIAIPSGTTVTTNATGEIALDTNGDGSSVTTGVIQGYDGTQNLYWFGATGYPSSDNDVMAYDSGSNSVTWQALSGSGGGDLTLISTATASSSASLDFTSGIDSTYDSYLFVFDSIIPVTDNTTFTAQTSTDGGSNYDSTANDYYRAAFRIDSSGTTITGVASETDTGIVMIASGNAAGESLNGYLYMFGSQNTSTHTHFWFGGISTTSTGSIRMDNRGIKRTSTTAINAITFYMSSGNISSGTIRLYGFNKT